MRKIAVALSKGGVGKTTTAVNLAAGLARRAQRVLIIDADTQGQVSRSLGVQPATGLGELVLGEASQEQAIFPARENLWLLGGGRSLAGLKMSINRKEFAGEQTLAAWLKHAGTCGARAPAAPPEREAIIERQQAVEELRPRADLREDLALLGEDVRAAVHPEVLVKWASAPAVPFPRFARPVAVTLALLACVTVAGWLADFTGSAPFTAVVLGELILTAILRRRVDAVVQAVERPAHDLEILSLVLRRLEQESFSSAGLAALGRKNAGVFVRLKASAQALLCLDE